MKHFPAILLMILLTACSIPAHVSEAEFKQEYAMVGMPQTMKIVEFTGAHDGRAFLKVRSMPIVGKDWKEQVIFIELNELDPEFRTSLDEQASIRANKNM